MADAKFSVSQVTTFHQTFEEDLATYAQAGVKGVGVWEFKLPEDGDDTDALARLTDSGLKATTCIPNTLSVWPVPFPGPDDPKERVAELCAAIERFAPFEPAVVLCLTGHPGDTDPAEARGTVVDGMRRAAKVAAEHGLTLGLEPLHREVYSEWSMINDIPGTIELIDEIGEPNVKVLYDLYHLWDTDNILEDTVRFGNRIVPSVHICDWRDPTRNDFDRALPGDGIMDLPALFGALDAGGVVDWFDLEIFSDDGSFSDQDFEDSLWKQDPIDVITRGREGFEKAWAARKVPA